MITLLANKISSFFLQKSLITDEERETYVFCFEVAISSILSWSSLFLLAFITKTFKPFLCYIFWFCLFRTTAGGYHAASHLRCYLLSIFTFIIFLVFQRTTPITLYPACSCGISFVSVLLLITLAPVEHPNNPFTEKEHTQHALTTKLFAVCYLIMQILVFTLGLTDISFNMSLGCLQAALSVAIAYYLNRERRQLS